ncbi:MAG: divalent-cation tolerance protein CutA [Desulfobacterales bacterium]|nr:divalent-cation tolerance protein CutA [Desulfobacterales bacterium]
MKHSMVIVTCPGQASAQKIARELIREQLAACVQLTPVTSVYTWEGRVEEEREIRLTIKTRTALYKEVENHIRRNHEYQVPQILRIPIETGLPDYLNWIEQNTREPFHL